ncbi:glutamate receptor [Seminavis robusta]|uniref:Glutamate receptor n=1 Tax=Seminavis robusta TaxID=568900 RepID=A0A9N8F0G1_9STRA|nr:glutamate receptor [Seminavis robusta]|eukprot:Sro2404_g326420.1 glutamate receptor (227) ;mRNA; r:3598-4278
MAKWVFSTENHLVLQSYDQGLCKAIVQGWVDVRPSPKFQEFMCSRNLVRVGDPVIQKLVAFPTRQEIVAGISHWIVDAETRGIFFDDAITKDPAMCNLEIQLTNHDEEEDSELQQLKPSNMLLPLVLFIFTCILALIFHAQRMVRLRSRAAVKPDALATTERLTTSDAPEDVLDADTEMDPTIENAEEAMKQLLIYHQTLLRRVKHTSQEGNKPPACSDDGSSQVG